MKSFSSKQVPLLAIVGLIGGAGACFDGPSPGEPDAHDGDKSAAPVVRKLAIVHADRMGEDISPEPRFMLQVLSQQELDEDFRLVFERCPKGSGVAATIGYCEVQVDDASGALQRMVEETMASITSNSTELRALVIGEPRLVEVDGVQKLALDSSHDIYVGQVPREIAHMHRVKTSPTLYRAAEETAVAVDARGFELSVERDVQSANAHEFSYYLEFSQMFDPSSGISAEHLADAYMLQARNAQYLRDELDVAGVFVEAAHLEGEAPGLDMFREGEISVLDVYRKVVAAE